MAPVFTIGYERRELPDLIAALQVRNVQRIIDVRQYPNSRRREFSKQALACALDEAGLDYVSFRELGTPRPIRDEYKATGNLARLFRQYQAYLHQHPELLDRLLELAEDVPICLLCYERDHTQCHRDVLAQQIESMTDMQIHVHHL